MKPLFLPLFLVVAQLASGQDRLNDQLRTLTDEIRNYEKNFRRLAVSRGMSYRSSGFTAATLKAAIAKYATSAFDEPVREFRFLFYNVRGDSLTIWLFDAEGSAVAAANSIVSVDSLMTLEQTLKRRIAVNNLLASRQAGYERAVTTYHITQEDATSRLTKILLPSSIAEKLAGTKYLCILPSLNISSLPFGMLRPWKNGGNLIDSMSYSFVYNLREFIDTADGENDRARLEPIGKYTLENPLIVGNPAFTDSCTRGLPALAGAESEARTISEKLRTTPLVGTGVVKTEVVRLMENSTFIFLATHGYSDQSDVMKKSFIALREPAGCGYLTPAEIQQLSLRSNAIVVLSACETGTGRTMDAGVIGLARGFLRAKAKAVVMSLWKVDDEQTRNFMLLLVDELQKKQLFFPAENFRRAVVRYRKTYSTDPLHWASFQTFGTPFKLWSENSLTTK